MPTPLTDADKVLRNDVGKRMADALEAIADGSGSSALADLEDVNVSNPTDGQALKYSAEESKWVNSDSNDDNVIKTNTINSEDIIELRVGSYGRLDPIIGNQQIAYPSIYTIKNLTVDIPIMQYGSGDPTPSNQRPFDTTFHRVFFTHTSNSIISSANIQYNIDVDTTTGEPYSNSGSRYNEGICFPDTDYYLQVSKDSEWEVYKSTYFRIFWYDLNHNYISYVETYFNDKSSRYVTSPSNAHYFALTYDSGSAYGGLSFNICLHGIDKMFYTYFDSLEPNIIGIDVPIGCSIDLSANRYYERYYSLSVRGLRWSFDGWNYVDGVFKFDIGDADDYSVTYSLGDEIKPYSGYCDYFKFVSSEENMPDNSITFDGEYFYIKCTQCSSVEDFVTLVSQLNPTMMLEAIAPLAVPIPDAHIVGNYNNSIICFSGGNYYKCIEQYQNAETQETVTNPLSLTLTYFEDATSVSSVVSQMNETILVLVDVSKWTSYMSTDYSDPQRRQYYSYSLFSNGNYALSSFAEFDIVGARPYPNTKTNVMAYRDVLENLNYILGIYFGNLVAIKKPTDSFYIELRPHN